MGLFSKAKKGLQPSSDQRGANDDALGGNAGRNTSTPDLDGAEGQAQQQYSQPDSQAPPQSQDKRAGKGLFGGRMRRRASSAAADDQSAAIPQQQQPYQAGRPISRSQMTKTAIVQDVIGRFCGLPEEDWNGVLDLADMLSSSADASKEAAESLRKEYKHGSAQAQERASKLLVVLMRNSTDRFKLQVVNKKFLKQMQDTFESSKTDPRVKAMLFKAVAVLAYEAYDDADLQPLVGLYVNIKPVDAPLGGIPTEEGDETFNPFSTRPARSSRRRNQTSGFDPRIQMEQLQQRISVARAEASMLTDSLAYTAPEDLQDSEVVQEFYTKVLAWQEFVTQQLPWAQAEADKAHRARDEQHQQESAHEGSGAAVPHNGASDEEKLLDNLLATHSEVHDALDHYHRLEQQNNRRAQEEADLIAATERSRVETRFAGEGAEDHHLSTPGQAVASSSGAPSRSNTPPLNQQQPDKSAFPASFQTTADAQEDTFDTEGVGMTASPERTQLKSRNPYARLSGASFGVPSPPRPVMPPMLDQGYVVDEPDEVSPLTPVARSNNPFLSSSGSRTRKDSEESFVPQQPSEKALGKMRHYSGLPVDAEEQQRQAEEALRKRYEEDYEKAKLLKQQKQGQQPLQQQQPKNSSVELPVNVDNLSILDEYDPYRAR